MRTNRGIIPLRKQLYLSPKWSGGKQNFKRCDMLCVSASDRKTSRHRADVASRVRDIWRPCSFFHLVTLISQRSLPPSLRSQPQPRSSVGCLQRIDRHGTQHKHEKSKVARASTLCATWPRTLSSNSGAGHVSFLLAHSFFTQ